MKLGELQERIKAQGYHIPASFRHGGSGRGNWREYLGFSAGASGMPGHREYSERHLRLVVAWIRVMELTGHEAGPPRVIHKAARMLAGAPDGFVYISEGRVGWSLVPPIYAMKRGAACWAVQP